jgi:adenine-specific DNA-methyltransferase
MVHFRSSKPPEGEHGNVKAKDDDKRFFIIHKDGPIAFDENGELVVNFEYRSDPEKGSKQEGSWRDIRNAEAAEAILKALEAAAKAANPTALPCLQLFKAAAPTEKDKKRPVLAKYVNQKHGPHTMDYFIIRTWAASCAGAGLLHQNEVMRLDDIENAEAPAVESYLTKIQVLRKIAGKLIDFLAQLRISRRSSGLRRSSLIETNNCITSTGSRGNSSRKWRPVMRSVKSGSSCSPSTRSSRLLSPGSQRPLTAEFLKANNKLVLDTRFFDDSFKARLVASIEKLR